ncbi:Transcription initiation factor TFIID subunit 1 [Spathaspora sp. JA1]|nr:Transcription initiation factor TFIID subunit 1 [Spathaspora sp. JA1]
MAPSTDSSSTQISETQFNKYLESDIPDDQIIESIFLEKKTQHADDAIDYEDIDELADEDELPQEEPSGKVEAGPGDEHDDLETLLEEGAITEEQAQEDADKEFDEVFGNGSEEDVDSNNNRLFNDLDSGHHPLGEEDDINDELLGIFDEQETNKHKLEVQEKLKLKRQKLQKIVKKLEKQHQKLNIKYHYPNYKRNKPFNFHLFFSPPAKYYKYHRPGSRNLKPLIPTKLNLEIEPDQRKLFNSRRRQPANNSTNITNITPADVDFVHELMTKDKISLKQVDYLKRDWTNDDKFDDYSKDLILSTTDWNDDAIINAGDSNKPTSKNIENNLLDIEISQDVLEEEQDEKIFNGQIDDGTFKLDMNDPNLLFIPKEASTTVDTATSSIESRFNISNDKEYQVLKNNYHIKVRSQLSNLNIEHSVPALRLQTPYYKVKLSSQEARSFHRPRFNIRPGSLISFSKLKLRKKKKDRGKSLQQVFKKTIDLTTADTANLIAMEYSEQYPQILSNFGMGSKIINYYAKENRDDSSRPKAQLGETHVLGLEDRSPFWNFGEVAKGDFVPTLYNNMIRAPIFKHENKSTDFLLIKSQGSGSHQKFYLRAINFNFAVGNTFPVVEVPAPHSRKVTNTSKNRLKMIVFRVMNNKGMARISVKDVSRHFPDQNDMQNRQRLKEFMEYQRQGDDQGFWKIKGSHDHVPSEDEIRAMITPEDSSMLDTMQYGQQALDDKLTLWGSEEDKKEEEPGKKKKSENPDDEEEDEEEEQVEDTKKEKKKSSSRDKEEVEIDIDEELAPWNLSKNFIIANQTKSMLQLNGEGDPTGIGLGYSFLRSTQKNGFRPLFPPPPENVPKSNTAAYQQKLYEQEIKRIWYSQRGSLVDHGPGFNLNMIYDEYTPVNHEQFVNTKLESEQDQGAILRITRRIRDENGILQRRVETLTDPRLIKAYIKRKKQIEDELLKNADVTDILPTTDKELNKLRRKALQEKLATLEKRAKQSKAKKPPKDSIHAAAAAGGTIIDANTVMLPDGSYAIGGKGIGKGKSRTRRCASCGAFGHIKTNKTCPLYSQMIAGTLPPKNGKGGAPATSNTASATPPSSTTTNVL